MTTRNHAHTSASFTVYRTQLSISRITEKHTNTHLPASLTTELNCQPHCLQYTQIHMPASLTTEYTNTSASLTDYRTQLPASLSTVQYTQIHLPASLTTEYTNTSVICQRSQKVEGRDRLRLQQTRQLMMMMILLNIRGAVAEWVRASTGDRTFDGSSPTSVKTFLFGTLDIINSHCQF